MFPSQIPLIPTQYYPMREWFTFVEMLTLSGHLPILEDIDL